MSVGPDGSPVTEEMRAALSVVEAAEKQLAVAQETVRANDMVRSRHCNPKSNTSATL